MTEQRNPFRCSRRIGDMRHFTRVRCAAVGSLMVFTFAGCVFAGFAFVGPAAAASTTTTVVSKFNSPDCQDGLIFCYVPSDATVSVGDTVLFTDQSRFRHTVTRCDPQQCVGHDGGTGSDPSFDAFVGPGPSVDFSHTFTGPGTYVYYCRIHGYANMHGTITVVAEGTSTTSTTTTIPTTTPASTPTTTATGTATTAAPTTTALATSAAPTPAATASSNVDAVEAATPRAPLARTGSNLRLVSVGLSAVGVGVVLVSAGHRTRRSRRR